MTGFGLATSAAQVQRKAFDPLLRKPGNRAINGSEKPGNRAFDPLARSPAGNDNGSEIVATGGVDLVHENENGAGPAGNIESKGAVEEGKCIEIREVKKSGCDGGQVQKEIKATSRPFDPLRRKHL
jgi:hypothetical protein